MCSTEIHDIRTEKKMTNELRDKSGKEHPSQQPQMTKYLRIILIKQGKVFNYINFKSLKNKLKISEY